MAFRSMKGGQPPLSATYNHLVQQAGGEKETIMAMRARLAASSILGVSVLNFSEQLQRFSDLLTASASLDATLPQYAKDQHGDQTYDLVAERVALQNKLATVSDWIAANFPRSANGYLEVSKMVNNKRQYRQFTIAQTATLRTLLDSIIASID